MAEVTIVRSASASVDASTAMVAPQLSQLELGEDVLACMPLQIKADGKLWKASGAAADANARIVGIAARAGRAGQTTTVLGAGTYFKYADETLTPGALIYLGTAGTLSTGTSLGDLVGIGQAVTASDIRLTRHI
jgi:hypothetical protein